MLWNIEEDVFTFKVKIQRQKEVCCQHLVAPFFLQKIILWHLWEDLKLVKTVLQSIQDNWEEWKRNIQQLPGVKIHRYFVAKGSKQIKHYSLHHFSYASETDYGQKTVAENNSVFCNIVKAKSFVTVRGLYQCQDWNWLLQH